MNTKLAPLVLGATIAAMIAAPATAGLLDPRDFQSLGTFQGGRESYHFNTSFVSDNEGHQGVVVDGIAVFTYDSVRIEDWEYIYVEGSRPIAILSKSTLFMEGQVDLSANDSFYNSAPGPGGGYGGGTSSAPDVGGGQGGGPGGGSGGGGGGRYRVPGYPYYPEGEIAYDLQGGSGGGGGSGTSGGGAGKGGHGAGGIEFGAVGAVTIGGLIRANGSAGGDGWGGGGGPPSSGGGGGSGGGILIHGESVNVSAMFEAVGGRGGAAGSNWNTGELGSRGEQGGGGLVLIYYGAGGYTDLGARFDLDGSEPGRFVVVPEPSAFCLTALGGLITLAAFHRRRSKQSSMA